MLTSLWNLNLSYNQIEDISVLDRLSKLDNLYLNGNKIKNLEPIMGLDIKKLQLNYNQIVNISWLKNSDNLISLKLSNNMISKIPSRLFYNFESLQELDLSSNHIKLIDSIGCKQNKRFYVVDLSKNELENVDFLQSCSSSLRQIKLNHNKITNLSSANFFRYPNLRKIDLSYNPLEISQDIKIAENLFEITLDANLVRSFINLQYNYLFKTTRKYLFYKTLTIRLHDQLNFVDCRLQIEFAKKNVLLNLFNAYQIDHFLSVCSKLDLS